MSTKGKGKGGPPPPPPSAGEGARIRAELQEQKERQKQEAQTRIKRIREVEARQRDLHARAATLGACDISSVAWERALAFVHLAGGKGSDGFGLLDTGAGGGVDLVELPDGAVCIRKGARLTTELVAEAAATTLGVRVARMRLVHPADGESDQISETIKRLMPDDPMHGHEKTIAALVDKMEEEDPEQAKAFRDYMNGRFTCAVLEYVPGVTLESAQEALNAASPDLFHDLGQILALDLLLNNFDRVPLPCWTSVGNLSNAVVTPSGRLVGIDQQVNPIEPGPGLEAYLISVRDIAGEILSDSFATSVSSYIRAAIARSCGVELSDESLAHVITAMRDTIREASRQSRDGNLARVLEAAAAAANEGVYYTGCYKRAAPASCTDVPREHAEFILRIAAALPTDTQ